MRSGAAENIAYSLSRWTDIVGTDRKWDWWQAALRAQSMISFDPHLATPATWSLRPQDVQSLIFWTKRPGKLLESYASLTPYNVHVNITATGWHEVERGAPSLPEACQWLKCTPSMFSTSWRFSPIPVLKESEVLNRFTVLAEFAAKGKLQKVYTSFLQANDKIPETRTKSEQTDLLGKLALRARDFGLYLVDWDEYLKMDLPENRPMTDPFTINESCQMGCAYCYAVNQPNKHNSLKVIR